MSTDPINQLARLFAQFPGIGERQSKRFVYFLLTRQAEYLQALANQIAELKKYVAECADCHRLFSVAAAPDNASREHCDYCRDTSHSDQELLVVEKDADYESIRKSGTYNGRYFILGGSVPIVEKNTRELVRSDALIQQVQKMAGANGGLSEVILAFSLTPQGEHTDSYIRGLLEPLRQQYDLTISSLGRGLSTGTELEYSDADTIKNALRNRG